MMLFLAEPLGVSPDRDLEACLIQIQVVPPHTRSKKFKIGAVCPRPIFHILIDSCNLTSNLSRDLDVKYKRYYVSASFMPSPANITANDFCSQIEDFLD